jgi:hypothetical protein
MKNITHMKKALAVVVLPLLFAVASFAGDDLAAGDNVVSWSRLVGVITSPMVSNPVAKIASGTTPWTTSSGSATIHGTGATVFAVRGLVLVGGDFSGTPGMVTKVKGTLVCNPGLSDQVVIDTPAVPLDTQGNANFSGSLSGALPSVCGNPLFLIRVPVKNVWIATGAVRVIS